MSRPLKSKTGFYNLKLESSTLLHRQVMEASPRNSILARTVRPAFIPAATFPLGFPLGISPMVVKGTTVTTLQAVCYVTLQFLQPETL